MNLETKITIYKFTPQVFTLTRHNFVYYMARVCHIDGTVGNYRILFYFFF